MSTPEEQAISGVIDQIWATYDVDNLRSTSPYDVVGEGPAIGGGWHSSTPRFTKSAEPHEPASVPGNAAPPGQDQSTPLPDQSTAEMRVLRRALPPSPRNDHFRQELTFEAGPGVAFSPRSEWRAPGVGYWYI